MRSGAQIRTLTRNGDISMLRFVTIQYRFSAMLQRGIKKQQQNIVRKFLSGHKTTVFDTQSVKKLEIYIKHYHPGKFAAYLILKNPRQKEFCCEVLSIRVQRGTFIQGLIVNNTKQICTASN